MVCESCVYQHYQQESCLLCKSSVHQNSILDGRISLHKMKQGEENNVNTIQINTANSEREVTGHLIVPMLKKGIIILCQSIVKAVK